MAEAAEKLSGADPLIGLFQLLVESAIRGSRADQGVRPTAGLPRYAAYFHSANKFTLG